METVLMSDSACCFVLILAVMQPSGLSGMFSFDINLCDRKLLLLPPPSSLGLSHSQGLDVEHSVGSAGVEWTCSSCCWARSVASKGYGCVYHGNRASGNQHDRWSFTQACDPLR